MNSLNDDELEARLRATYIAVARTTTVTPRPLEFSEHRPALVARRVIRIGLVAAGLLVALVVVRRPTGESNPALGSADLRAVPSRVPSGFAYVGLRGDSFVFEGGGTRIVVIPAPGRPWDETTVSSEAIEGSPYPPIDPQLDVVRDGLVPLPARIAEQLTLRSGYSDISWTDAGAPQPFADTGATISTFGRIGQLYNEIDTADHRGVALSMVQSAGDPPWAVGIDLDPGHLLLVGNVPPGGRFVARDIAVKPATFTSATGTYQYAVIAIDTSESVSVSVVDEHGNDLTDDSK